MVGTHADKPFQDIEEMNVQIRKKLSGKRCGRHVNTQYFSVDNTQSSSDAGVIKLRDEILKVLKREPYIGEQVPVRYCVVYKKKGINLQYHYCYSQSLRKINYHLMESKRDSE